MWKNSFPSQKQVELLQVLNYALYKRIIRKDDLCGIIDRKIRQLYTSLCLNLI
jgi:hypothetical protein